MRTAAICPTCATYTNAVCVIYDGPYLSNLDINPLTSLDEALQQINFIVGGLEKTANKSINIIADQASNIKYPSVKAVYTWATATFQPVLGFTPENVANKSTNVLLGTSNTLYPTQNAVKTYVDTEIAAIPIPDLQQVTAVNNATTLGVYTLDNISSPSVQAGLLIDIVDGASVVLENITGGIFASLTSNKLSFTNGASINTVNVKATNIASSVKNIELPNASGTLALSVNGNTANTSGNITIPHPNRVYVAVISMVDGSIINLLKNTIGDTLTWTASSGVISTTSSILASENNTFVSVTGRSTVPKIISTDVSVSSLSWNVSIYQTDNAGAPNSTDAVYVEIRIY
jgi:hypothetical protein